MISEKSTYITRYTFRRGAWWHHKSQQGTQKNFGLEFPILSTLKLYSCVLVVFIDMNTYILAEGRNFKTFLKENYTTEHGTDHDIDSAYGVCIR